MPTGSCLCHSLKYEYTSEPITTASILDMYPKFYSWARQIQATCHCLSCRKVTGGTNSVNLLLPEDKLRVTDGTAKEYSSLHESGVKLTVHFCANCGCTIYKTHEKFPGMVIVLAGTLDDAGVENTKPKSELYSKHRVGWLPTLNWAEQKVEFWVEKSCLTGVWRSYGVVSLLFRFFSVGKIAKSKIKQKGVDDGHLVIECVCMICDASSIPITPGANLGVQRTCSQVVVQSDFTNCFLYETMKFED